MKTIILTILILILGNSTLLKSMPKLQSYYNLAITNQKINNNDFPILNLGIFLQLNEGVVRDGIYAGGNINLGINKILVEVEGRLGYSIRPLNEISLKVYCITASNVLFLSSIQGGCGVGIQINDKKGVNGLTLDYFYRDNLKIWDVKAEQWYIRGIGIRLGLILHIG